MFMHLAYHWPQTDHASRIDLSPRTCPAPKHNLEPKFTNSQTKLYTKEWHHSNVWLPVPAGCSQQNTNSSWLLFFEQAANAIAGKSDLRATTFLCNLIIRPSVGVPDCMASTLGRSCVWLLLGDACVAWPCNSDRNVSSVECECYRSYSTLKQWP